MSLKIKILFLVFMGLYCLFQNTARSAPSSLSIKQKQWTDSPESQGIENYTLSEVQRVFMEHPGVEVNLVLNDQLPKQKGQKK